MPDKFRLKRGIPSSTKKKIIVDSATSEDESLLAWSKIARPRIQRSPNDSTASRTVRTEPASITMKAIKNITFTIDSQSSSDDDDSLLKPMVATNRRRVTNSPSFLSRKVKSPPHPKNSSRALDDSSVDTAELELLLLKPTPKPSAAGLSEKLTSTAPPRYEFDLETRPPNPHSRKNIQANDDSSEDTEELTRILLGNRYSPSITTRNRENPPSCDRKLPSEIKAVPSSGVPGLEESDNDNFELPEPDESSGSSVDSQSSENREDQKLPARVPPLHPNDEGRVPINIYRSGPFIGRPGAPEQERYTPMTQPRDHVDPTVYHNNPGALFSRNRGGAASGDRYASQARRHPPDPAKLPLCDLREAALFDASGIDDDLSGRSSPSPKRGRYSSHRVPEGSHLQLPSDKSGDQLEQEAFFSDSQCYGQLEITPTQVRTGLHSPRPTPFSQVPPARASEQLREDFIQDFSDEETAVQRFGRLASQALQQKRQSLLQTAQSHLCRNEPEISNHNGGPRRFRDVSICDTSMSRSVVLRQTEGGQLSRGLAPRNDLIDGSGAGLTGFAFAHAPNGRGRGSRKRSGGWKGRGKWGKSKGKKQGGTGDRGRGTGGGNNTGFSTRPSTSTGGFSRGDDANLRHVGGAEFSF